MTTTNPRLRKSSSLHRIDIITFTSYITGQENKAETRYYLTLVFKFLGVTWKTEYRHYSDEHYENITWTTNSRETAIKEAQELWSINFGESWAIIPSIDNSNFFKKDLF